MSQTQYCLCCGEDVPVNTVYREGKHEITCLYCGFTLGEEQRESEKTAACILTADDSSLIRNLMQQILTGKNLAEEVLSFENGMTFLGEFSNRLSAGKEVSLVILDLEMPVMDGLKAALTLRTLETKMDVSRPVPVIFFSGKKCDEALKKKLAQCTPATYFNKGGNADPAGLSARIDRLVKYILSRRENLDGGTMKETGK